MVDFVKLSPESFRTLYLRGENRVILLTEAGRRIIVERIVGSEWTPYRIYEFEQAKNENKREIFLIDRRYLSQIDTQLERTLRDVD
jgi:hypothetical protein